MTALTAPSTQNINFSLKTRATGDELSSPGQARAAGGAPTENGWTGKAAPGQRDADWLRSSRARARTLSSISELVAAETGLSTH